MSAGGGGYGAGGYGVGGYGGNGGPVFTEEISYYLSLVTSQYQGSPKFLAWLKAPLQILDDMTSCLYMFSWQFDISNAVGPQLDIIGQIVGASRTVSFQPSGGVSPVLDDATYRILLLATIARNQWDGRIDSLQSIWGTLFPGGQIKIVDNQDMTFNVVLSGVFTSILQDLITHDYIVPRPQAVLVNPTFSDLPIFGFETANTSFIAGFGLGKWA